jgi:DNA-binding response OmpR family regulator
MAGETNTTPASRRILLVEDEILICLLIETILSDAGYEVVVANTIDEAMDAVAEGPLAAAVLDLNLKGKKVFPVAEKLAASQTPFIFATGGGGRDIEGFPGRPWVGKPFQEAELLAAVVKLIGLPGASR